MNLLKENEKKTNFVNRLKYAVEETVSICSNVYILYEDDDFNEFFEVLSIVQNIELKFKDEFIEKYEKMKEFEHNYRSTTAINYYRIGFGSIRLMEWIAFDDNFKGNINKFDLMASVLSCLNDISNR